MTLISRKAQLPELSIIIDSPQVILTFIYSLIGTAISGYLLYYFLNYDKSIWVGAAFAILSLFSVMGFIRSYVISKGYIIDLKNGKFFFPGGGISADSWVDYFKPKFIFQALQRREINLKDIRSVQEFIDKTYFTDAKGRRRVQRHKMLEITGNFGAITFEFYSKGKMDQLYASIINLNKMGYPISY